MKTRPARLAVLLMAVVGLVSAAVPPARATTTRTVAVFVGAFSQSDALTTAGGAVACVNGGSLDCARTVAFSFGSTVCQETTAPGKGGPSAGPCSVSISGTLTGYTGAATGAASVLFLDSMGRSFSAPATVVMVGDVLTLNAQSDEGAFGATIVLFPDPEPEPTEPDPPPPPPRQGNGLAGRG